jgi:hypothetical protein
MGKLSLRSKLYLCFRKIAFFRKAMEFNHFNHLIHVDYENRPPDRRKRLDNNF